MREITIIIPVYKAEAFLHQCIDSVLAQTFTDYELILVDDGSPDHSGEICDMYAQKDSRIKVLHRINGGVSSARNAALDVATGKYVVFVDSDDFVGPNYLCDLHDAAQRNPESTMILADYQPFSASGPESREFPQPFQVSLNHGTAENFRNLMFDFRLFPPYCKLYRLDIIQNNHIRFHTQIKSAEDFDFNMRYVQHMERIAYIPSTQYYYRVDYKTYIPSNRGVLGDSEVISVHIMAHGMVDFAKRMGIYPEMRDEICLWAANKHYFNRLRMLFRRNDEIKMAERYRLYQQLIADKTYRDLARKGVRHLPDSTTKWIARYFDCFLSWWLFYKLTKQF